MKSYFNGIVLNFQFFTIIPIRKEVPMTMKNIDRMIRTFPLFGFIIGLFYFLTAYMMNEWTSVSSLIVAFSIWLLSIVITGAIHLDGWIDMTDAFFSYQDRAKRLEIMNDPRTGAFGVISVIVLLAAKFLFIYEIIRQVEFISYVLFLFIPFFTRMLAGIMLSTIQSAKQEGLGSMFQKAIRPRTLWFYVGYIIVISIMLFVWQPTLFWMVLVMLLTMVIIFMYIRTKIVTSFGGITGDVVGASIEGVEVCLWIVVWLFHYFVMG